MEEKKELSRIHKRILEFIVKFEKATGKMPSNLQIFKKCGIPLKSVGPALQVLRRRGYLKDKR